MIITRARLGLAGLVAVILMAAPACFLQPDTPAPPCTVDQTVDAYEFGDSLSAWAKLTPAPPAGQTEPGFTGICERFDGISAGVSVNAMGGTRADHHLPTMAHIQPGTCALVFLGTNDLSNLTLAEATTNATTAIETLRDAGARRIVWALLDENSAAHRSAAQLAETRGYNQWLIDQSASATYGDLLVLADWRAASAGHNEYLLLNPDKKKNDPVHHTDDGADAYAAFIVASYQELCA